MPVNFHGSIREITHAARDVFLVRIALQGSDGIHFSAGQFVMFDIPQGDKVVPRAFSIASHPSETTLLDFYVKYIPGGAASEFFAHARPGDAVTFRGPLGQFVLPAGQVREVVMVATSTGMAPFCAMLKSLCAAGGSSRVSLYFGCRSEEDVFLQEEVAVWARALSNFSYTLCLSKPKSGAGARVTNHLAHLDSYHDKEFYLCGNKDMVQEARQLLLRKGVPMEQIHLEIFF